MLSKALYGSRYARVGVLLMKAKCNLTNHHLSASAQEGGGGEVMKMRHEIKAKLRFKVFNELSMNHQLVAMITLHLIWGSHHYCFFDAFNGYQLVKNCFL